MKLTCLSKGQGYHFPPCHIIEIGGFRVLVNCPLDLSALSIFAPIPVHSDRRIEEAFDCSSLEDDSGTNKSQKVESCIDASSLIHAVPWYKTVSTLHLWDVSFINVVLITSPMGMLGLPFLTRNKNFSAMIYATEATTRLGQLLMEDFVSLHKEFRQFYGPQDSGNAHWMNWEEIDKFPPLLQKIILGKDGSELGGWLPLYSAADAKESNKKVQPLKYAEETCYAGSLVIKAFSSGLDIGTSNWVIKSPKKYVTFLSSSVFGPAQASCFDYHALEGQDIVVFSDYSSVDDMENVDDEIDNSAVINQNVKPISLESLLTSDESSGEEQKLAYICSYAVDSLKGGGSVLIPIGRFGVILELLEQISILLECLTLKVPIFFISSVAEEFLSYTNIIPEWLCLQRQKKFFAGEPLFAHVDLVKEKKLHILSSICAADLLEIWQEPCIVFAPHMSLRVGPAVHFLNRWRGSEKSLLIMEKGLETDLALLPFKPMAMKVLQCSFLSGIGSSKIVPLLQKLQPQYVLFPEDLRTLVCTPIGNSFSFIYYSEKNQLRIPSLKKHTELEIPTDIASQFQWITLKEQDLNIARLKGELALEHGKHRLLTGCTSTEASVKLPILLAALQRMGIGSTAEQATSGESSNFVVHVHEPSEAFIEVQPTKILINSSDNELASRIFEAVNTILSGRDELLS